MMRKGMSSMIAMAVAGFASIGKFFAEAFVGPSRWLAPNHAKRSRIGSRRANPAGHSAPSIADVRAGKWRWRERFMRGTPTGPHALGYDMATSPYPSKAAARFLYANTVGNNGRTVNLRLRGKFWSGRYAGIGAQAAKLGIAL